MADEGSQSAVDAWGDDIPPERQAELDALAERQREWAAQPESERGDSAFEGVRLTGADVFWLAARALAGTTDVQAVSEQMERLRRARDDWNLQRTLSLEGLHVEGANIDDARLERAVLNEAHQDGVSLRRARLDRAFLYTAHLRRANLAEAHLGEVTLAEANLTGASLAHADLRGAHLGNTNLSDADLQYANLRGAGLWRTRLWGAALAHATLHDAKVLHADLQGADLRDAQLDLGDRLGTTFPWWNGPLGFFVQAYLCGVVFFPCLELVVLAILAVKGQFRLDMMASGMRGFLVWLALWTASMALIAAATWMLEAIQRRRKRSRSHAT